jgi:ankyrin repeat protein
LVEPFVIAAHGDFDRMKELLAQEPAMLNVPWARFDETALQAASHMGRRDIAEYLLEQGAPLNICTAAMLGNADDVSAFLQQDPTLANAKGAHGIPLMFHAAYSGKPEIGDLLISHGGGEGMNSSLHAAVISGKVEMVRWLLDNGVTDVNPPDFNGKTPLDMAESLGHSEIATLLRERGGVTSS